MHRTLGTAFVVVALVAIPAAAGIIGASRPANARRPADQSPAKTQVSGMPLLGYGAPAKT